MSHYHDHPGVVIYPPALWFASLSFGLVLQYLLPMPIGAPTFLRMVGFVIILLSGGLLYWAGAVFQEFGEDSDPTVPTRHFIDSGPYKFCRNPMYLAGTISLLGSAIVFNSWWLFFATLVQLYVLHFGVVMREEKYMLSRFGDEYRRYMKRVPRWV